MKAACGCYHTVTIDHNENVWSFGTNNKGALGIEEVSEALSPQKVPLLQSIVSVACGVYHTCCLDSKGMVWTFGENSKGELGRTGNPRIPTQVEGMPPISTITCGQFQTICSTNTLSLWAFGQNGNGELGLGHSNHQKTPAQIPMDNISSVAIGQYHSLFLHQNGTVFASGYNSYGELGLGHTNQVTSPQQIPNFQKIIQIATKHLFSLFLSEEGKVFACGYNGYGQYGNVGSCTSPTQVPELPEIQRIFVGYHSSYLIDKKGSLWVIGHNANGELGIRNNTNQKVPVLNANIQNINFISAGHHTIVKCNSGELYVFGQNNCGQLGLGNKTAVNMPTAHPKPNICSEIDSKEIMKSKEVYSMLEALIKLQESGCGWSSTDIKKVMNLQNLTTKSNTAPPMGWKSWREAFQFLQNKIPQITKMISEQKKISQVRNEQLKKMEVELEILLQKIEETKNEIRTFDEIIDLVDEPISQLQNLEASVQQLAQEEDKMLGQFTNLLKTKRIEDLSAAEMEIVLWRMGLSHCASLFVANEIGGKLFSALGQDLLLNIGFSRRDSCAFMYYRKLMRCRGFLNPEIAGQNAEECVVCFHDSPVKTLELLQEYGIELDKNVIVDHCWTAPLLIYLSDFGEEFKNLSMRERIKISGVMNQWKELHRLHLASLK